MQPQQQPIPPTEYEFIMNPQKPQSPLGDKSVMQRLVFAGIGFVILLILGSVLLNLIRGSDKSIPSLITVAQYQQSLIHISEAASVNPRTSASTRAATTTIQIVIGSQQQELFSYFNTNKVKVKKEQIGLRVSPAIDAELKAAGEGGTYDTVLKEVLNAQLKTYKQSLSQAYEAVKGSNGKALIKKDFDATELLIKKLNSDNR